MGVIKVTMTEVVDWGGNGPMSDENAAAPPNQHKGEDNISTLSYLINLQDTKLEHENEEETYLNEETAQLITDKYEERLKLESLGKLLPINTPTEPVIFNIAMQRAVAFPVPIRRKKAETKLMVDPKLVRQTVTLVQNRTSLAMDARVTGSGAAPDRTSIVTGANEVKSRVSKTVDFGIAKQVEVEVFEPEWDDILLDKKYCNLC